MPGGHGPDQSGRETIYPAGARLGAGGLAPEPGVPHLDLGSALGGDSCALPLNLGLAGVSVMMREDGSPVCLAAGKLSEGRRRHNWAVCLFLPADSLVGLFVVRTQDSHGQ